MLHCPTAQVRILRSVNITLLFNTFKTISDSHELILRFLLPTLTKDSHTVRAKTEACHSVLLWLHSRRKIWQSQHHGISSILRRVMLYPYSVFSGEQKLRTLLLQQSPASSHTLARRRHSHFYIYWNITDFCKSLILVITDERFWGTGFSTSNFSLSPSLSPSQHALWLQKKSNHDHRVLIWRPESKPGQSISCQGDLTRCIMLLARVRPFKTIGVLQKTCVRRFWPWRRTETRRLSKPAHSFIPNSKTVSLPGS